MDFSEGSSVPASFLLVKITKVVGFPNLDPNFTSFLFFCPSQTFDSQISHIFPKLQMIFNTCFALSDCDGELPESFGFVLLDFKAGPFLRAIWKNRLIEAYKP